MLKPHTADIIQIALEAGEAIMAIYHAVDDSLQTSFKSDQSPLTAADLAAHQTIIKGLKAITPDIPILSEESDAIPFEVRSQWSRYWLADPLDGTREFIKRNGEFTVNIALIEGQQSVMGVVYAPAINVLYYADETGAYRQRGDATVTPIHVRKASIQNMTLAGSRSHADARLDQFIHSVSQKLSPIKVISMGSSLKICLVAEGEADVYPRLGPTSEWDTAAAQCILERAGGKIVDLDGNRLHYNHKHSLLNPDFLATGQSDFDWRQYLD